MKQSEKMQELGNNLVLTAIAFNQGINDFCKCKDLSKISDSFDKLTDLMTAHMNVVEALTATCPQALIELTQLGMTNLFNGGDE